MKKRELELIFFFIIILEIILILNYLPTKQVFLAPGESGIIIIRTLPTSVNLNQEFTVTINIYVDEANKPTALGITETIPQAWNLGTISGADYTKSTYSGIEILLFSLTGNINDKIITYKITPTNTESTFSGTWDSVSPDDSGTIEGDTNLTIKQGGDNGNEGNGGDSEGGGPGGGGGGGSGASTPITPTQTTRTCIENWFCTDWSDCINEQKARTCTDLNNCGTSSNKPLTSASCNPVISAAEQVIDYSIKNPEVPISTGLIIAIIIVIIIIISIITLRKQLARIMPHIEKAKSQGYSVEQIKQSLLKKGWPKKIIKRIK